MLNKTTAPAAYIDDNCMHLQHGVVVEEADHGQGRKTEHISPTAAPKRCCHRHKVVASEGLTVAMQPEVFPYAHCFPRVIVMQAQQRWSFSIEPECR